MIRGTTPTHTFTFSINPDDAKEFVVTYVQNDEIVLEKRKNDCTISGGKIEVMLTQEETLLFKHGVMVEMQAKALLNSGLTVVSDIVGTNVNRVLNEEVLV